MYAEGIVTQVDGYRAKIKIREYDDFETEFLSVPQLFTVNNKSGFKPEIGALVSAVLSDDMTDGAILGQIYNDEDLAPEDKNEFIQFSDGVSICHEEGKIIFNAEDVVFNSNVKCSEDVYDRKGTMEMMRTTYNSHAHTNGNEGANTGGPTAEM